MWIRHSRPSHSRWGYKSLWSSRSAAGTAAERPSRALVCFISNSGNSPCLPVLPHRSPRPQSSSPQDSIRFSPSCLWLRHGSWLRLLGSARSWGRSCWLSWRTTWGSAVATRPREIWDRATRPAWRGLSGWRGVQWMKALGVCRTVRRSV